MASYRLKPDGSIRHARRYVGSVRRAADGIGFVGRIGEHCSPVCTTMEAAFREVAARAMGFATLGALREHNRRIRARNRVQRAVQRAAIRSAAARAPERPVPATPDEPYWD